MLLDKLQPFYRTLQDKKITKYQLIYHWGISSNTLRRMGLNEPINTTTLNELCLILDCKVEDILSFEPTEEELQDTEQRKASIIARKEESRNRKKKAKK